MASIYSIISWVLLTELLIVCFVLYVFFKLRYQYWSKKGVPGPKPSFPLGNLNKTISEKKTFPAILSGMYEEYKHLPYVGFYLVHRPALLINDLELVKTIMVRDFAHFTDHGFEFKPETQPLVNHLFNTKGGRWKGVRTKLSPVFTSSKMRYMFKVMADCGEEMQQYLKNDIDINAEIDIKEVIAKYSINVIVSCAFGLESNCFKNPDTEFRTLGRTVFDLDMKRNLALMLMLLMPDLSKKLDIKMVDKRLEDFFISTVENTVKYREENNIQRNDLMQLLIRLKNNENIDDETPKEAKNSDDPDVHLTPMEMASQAFGFFVGGFETTSTTSAFIFYEICKHPEVQSRMREEIDDVIRRHGGKMTYDALMDMTYMTQVIEETLRLHPVVPQMIRVCTKDYVMPNTNVTVEKGTLVMISTEGIHKDPNYYPDPEIFDPENFNPENKAARHHFTHIPFGEGPRICIGMRFANLVMKIGLVSILRNYETSLSGDGKLHLIENSSFISSPSNVNVILKSRS